jgi:FAD/FMN-containing dehydrogenase
VPTSDQITLAGALAACVHSSGGYFADSVRAFRFLEVGGAAHECSVDAEGIAKELYWAVPGSFGALGITTHLELRLEPIHPEQLIGVHSRYAGPSSDDRFFQSLEATRDDPTFAEGVGAVIYGSLGHAIVLGDERLPLGHQRNKHQAPLTDEDLEEHAFTQGLANRFPRIAESKVSESYPNGMMRWAPWYGFQFYQRGYDKAYEVLGRSGMKYKLARLAGVDRRVPVVHQAWFFPRSELRKFVRTYFDVLSDYPGIEKQVEQQDIVLLAPSKWPAHSLGATDGDVGVFTASYSVAALTDDKRERIVEFFRKVSDRLLVDLPTARVSLCKQVHCPNETVRRMHAPWIELIGALKARVDPKGVLTSRHIRMLLG